MPGKSSVINDWKRLWTHVSGINRETPQNAVLESMQQVSKDLLDGLFQFKPQSASKTDLETLLKENKQEQLLPFTLRLQELLDLESKQCWDKLCYFLTNEYRGSASSLEMFIATETNMSRLLSWIWGYYSLERTIILKIVKNLLLFYKDSNHPYHKEYAQIVDKLTLPKLRDSYLRHLEHLINGSPPGKLMAGEFFNYKARLVLWSERNAREINEVLHILLLLCEHLPMEIAHVKQIFDCINKHSFGKQQRYIDNSNPEHIQLLENIVYSELALILKCFDIPGGIDNPRSRNLANEIINALEKDVVRMYHNPENGPLLLAWMVFNLRFTEPAKLEESFAKLNTFGNRALSLGCFNYLKNLVSNYMFSDESLVSVTVRRTIYNLLNSVCDFFDTDGSCARHDGIYELLCAILYTPTLAKEFCETKGGGVISLYNTLLECFPLDFEHISMVAKALTKAGMGIQIKNRLEALPIFTDVYDDSKYKLCSIDGDEYTLTHAVSPYSYINFTIPAGTSVVVMHRTEGLCAHFRSSVNYFDVLHNEINCLLSKHELGNSARIRRVENGISYLETIIEQTKSIAEITEEMVPPTELCIDILHKFKPVQNPPIRLLAKCLNVCTGLLPLADLEIFTRVNNLYMLPVVMNETLNDYKKYASGISFDPGVVGSYFVNIEKNSECYDFLLAYLNYLRTYTKLQRHNYFQMEIPGLIYILRNVFPHLLGWSFTTQQDKYKIYIEIMGFLCDILDIVTDIKNEDKKIAENKKLVRNICVYSLLSMENGLILLRFVAIGNGVLQHAMQMESNWMRQQSYRYALLVRHSMRILMQILRLKHCVFDGSSLSPLEELIYTQPKERDSLRIISVVASYINNIFDRWLPLISCRLLKRFALEYNMSMLTCLDMEPDQIRITFLQKLPDEFESDSLKIAILEFVEACMEKQPGVTEAFFKLDKVYRKRLFDNKETNASIGLSIVTYLEDYLNAVGKDPLTIEQPLPGKVMNIFHSLWIKNMQVLVEEIVEKPKFWEHLFNPLFSDLRTNGRAYTQLLNILGTEIFSSKHKNTEIQKIITRFFEANHFKKWLDYLLDLPKVPFTITNKEDISDEDLPDWLCRLQSFKNFLTILLKKQPVLVEVPTKQLKLLAERCLCVLVDRARYNADLRPFILLLELYLYVLLSFKHSYTESSEEDHIMLHQLIELLCQILPYYTELNMRAREASLSIFIKCTQLLAEELRKDSIVALKFLHSVIDVICFELESLETCTQTENGDSKSSLNSTASSKNSAILSLNLLKAVANVFDNDGPTNWDLPFITNRMFQRLLISASSILATSSKYKLSAELLDVLIIFAKGNCSVEFLHCDISFHLFLQLMPPKELVKSQNYAPAQSQPQAQEWTDEKWWPIYSRGIELMSTVFYKHERFFIKDVLLFIGIHQESLVDALLLSKQTLQPAAVNLIKSAVSLISNTIKFKNEWHLEHPDSLFNVIRAVQVLMGHCISMFHQPKYLRSLILGRRGQFEILQDSENVGWVDEVIKTLNDLLEIIILCAKTLLGISPKLLELICEPEILYTKWEPVFEINFGVPKMDENSVHLTFGSVLGIIGVLTKALSLQNYCFHEAPLNTLPTCSGDDTVDVTTAATPAKQSAHVRSFSKSLSVASVSSVNCTPNELLSNLDSELCILALENVLMLIASQSMLTLRNPNLPPREKQLVRREISAELLTYQEFVRKRVLIEHRDYKDLWRRRKHGLILMHSLENDESTSIYGSNIATPVLGTQSRLLLNAHRSFPNDLRINVIKRLHLQRNLPSQQQRATEFETTQVLSPIGAGRRSGSSEEPKSKQLIPTSTPHVARQPVHRPNKEPSFLHNEHENRAHSENVAAMDEDEEIIFFPPEEPKYSPLSYVQLVEEDFLHFMSSLFIVICQSQ